MRRLIFGVTLLSTLVAPTIAHGQSPPPCADPAPLLGPASCGPADYVVIFKSGTDAIPATRTLEMKYGFTANKILGSPFLGFDANGLTTQLIAQLRCEPEVANVQRNLPLCITGPPCPPDPVPSGPCPPVAVPVLGAIGRIVLAIALGAGALIVLRPS